jgi:hypothetical protein
MRGYVDDLVYAARRLKRSPAFSITALAILGLGIGVNVTAFSVVNALLLQPPPFADPDGVVLVLQSDDGGNPSSTSYPAYQDMREYPVFESVSLFYSDQGFLGRPGETLSPILIQTLARAQAAEAGFNWEDTAFAQVNISPLGLEGEAATGTMDRLEERLEALPMITAVSRSIMLPAAQFGTTTLLLGAAIDGTDRPVEVPWNVVSPDFFTSLDIPLPDGRLFTDLDAEGPTVAVVSASFAMTYCGRADVVGEVYRSEGDPESPVEIVGVVDDVVVRSLGESPTPSLYWPLIFSSPRMNLLFRYEGESAEALGAAQAAIKEVDSRIMVLRTQSMEEHLGSTLVQQRLTGIVLSSLGILALVLAMIGVYGVVSVAVSQRRREVGIRIALGAASESVVGLFVRDIAVVVVAGAVIGCVLAIPATSTAGQMFTGTPGTALLAVGAGGLLLLTSLLATIIPAARATSTDPTEALREE